VSNFVRGSITAPTKSTTAKSKPIRRSSTGTIPTSASLSSTAAAAGADDDGSGGGGGGSMAVIGGLVLPPEASGDVSRGDRLVSVCGQKVAGLSLARVEAELEGRVRLSLLDEFQPVVLELEATSRSPPPAR
jgi:hypothetical protein